MCYLPCSQLVKPVSEMCPKMFVLSLLLLATTAYAEQCSLSESVGKLLQTCREVKDCPNGWVKNTESGSCYKLVKTKKTYSAAKSTCQQSDAQVVSLNTMEEYGFVWQYVYDQAKPYQQFWIGLKRVGGGWRWEDGTSMSLPSAAFWQKNEPNNSGGAENNVHMYSNSNANDVRGTNKYYFVCEKKILAA
ncbi:hepatic lectin-like [Diadema antillarum]|uniref:hepatic lectin-like n=1 Tax=Diadema antillarum TaxID=105358 RepID=UPI003A84B9EE